MNRDHVFGHACGRVHGASRTAACGRSFTGVLSILLSVVLAIMMVPAAALAAPSESDEKNQTEMNQVVAEDTATDTAMPDKGAESQMDDSQDDSVGASFTLVPNGEDEAEGNATTGESSNLVIPAASERINQDVALQTRTVAQAESTRSYFLAQTLESTRSIPVVSANLPLDTEAVNGPVASGEDAAAFDDGEEGEGSDDPDSEDSNRVISTEETDSERSGEISPASIVVGSFTYRGITYAVEPGGETVAVVAADCAKLPQDFIEAQTIVLPSMVSANEVDYYSVTRIADNAFAALTTEADGITTITIPASVTSIGDDAFAGFDTLQYIIVSEDNLTYGMYDGCLYDADLTNLLLIPGGRLGAVSIAPSAKTIAPEAFSLASGITEVLADADSAAYQLLEGDDFTYDASDDVSTLDIMSRESQFAGGPYKITIDPWYHPLRDTYGIWDEDTNTCVRIISTTQTQQFGTFYDHKFPVSWWTANPGGMTVAGATDTPGHIYFHWYEAGDPGYTLLGFREGYDSTEIITETAGFRDAFLVALWKNNEYTITLNAGDGSGGTSSTTATYNRPMPEITPPTLTGYKLEGFFDAASGGKQYYWGSGVSANYWDKARNTTLYAQWTARTYEISFNANYGTGGQSATVTATFDSEMPPIDSTEPTRTGYGFQGWYDTSANSGGNQYYTKQGTSFQNWNQATNKTLYARWKPNTYTITFEGKGGTGGQAGSSATATYDAAMPSISTTPPQLTGYTFRGWYNANGIQYYTKAGTSEKKWTTADNATLFAEWDANTYSLSLQPNGKQPNSIDVTLPQASVPTTYDGSFSLPVATRVGYNFDSWNTLANGTGTRYEANTVYEKENLASAEGASVPLYAQWSAKSYSVTFVPDMEGKSSVTKSPFATFDADLPERLSSDVLATDTDGFRFEGYYDANGVKYYNANGTRAVAKWDKAADTTLTAKWTYDVFFDTNTDDATSVLFGSAASQVNETMPLSAGREVTYTYYNDDIFGNARYVGVENGQDRVKIVAWKGAKVVLPVAQLRSGYDATQDWGKSAASAYVDRIRYDATTGATESALSALLPATGTDLSRTLYAIWDVDPNGNSGHARTYYVKLYDQTSYDQNGQALAANNVVAASPTVLRVKYDTQLLAQVNTGGTTVKAPSASDGLVFGGYYAALAANGVADTASAKLTGGRDASGNVAAGAGVSLWRIAPVQKNSAWVDETTNAPLRVERARYGNTDVDAVVVYAHWSLPVRSIEFDRNLSGMTNDLGSLTNIQVNVTPLPNSLNAAYRLADTEDYVFDGWWDDRVHGRQYYDRNGALVTSNGAAVIWPDHENTTLYAHWTYELRMVENLGGHAATDRVALNNADRIVDDKGNTVRFTEKTVGTGEDARHVLAATLNKGETVTLYDAAADVATLAERTRDGQKTGYVFCGYSDMATGWENSSERYRSYDFSQLTKRDKAVNIYMCWRAQRSPLKFVNTLTYNGETLDPSALTAEGGRPGDQSKNTGVAYDARLVPFLTSELPAIPGWNFKGYSLVRKDGTTVPYIDEAGQPVGTWVETSETVNTDANGAVTLQANYEQKHHRVSVDYHGGNGNAPEFRSVTYKQTLEAGPFKPARKGYEFAGWYKCEDADKNVQGHVVGACAKCVKYYDENGLNTSVGCQRTWNIDGDGTLHAAWNAVEYTISWNNNYTGASATTFDQTTQTYDAVIDLPSGTPKRPGYSFAGWYTRPVGGDYVSGADGCVFGHGAFEPSDDATFVTYYAQWGEPKDYSVTLLAGVGGYFDVNGEQRDSYVFRGTGATSSAINIAPSGTEGSDNAPWSVEEKLWRQQAFIFDGWEELEGESDPISVDSLRADVIPANTEGVHMLKAKWRINDFAVAFYAYDPDMEPGDTGYEVNERMKTDATMTSALGEHGSKVTWKYAAAEKEGTDYLPWNAVTNAPEPSFAGYRFTGWRLRGNDTLLSAVTIDPQNPAVDLQNPHATMEYVACFEQLSYTVHFFVSDREEEDDTIEVPYEGSFPLPAIAARRATGESVADEEANTLTSSGSYVYNGFWDVAMHWDSAYAPLSRWTPGTSVSMRELLSTEGVEPYAAAGSPDESTHVNLYARHRDGYSFTVPLRASILVAVDDPAAPIQTFAGAVSTENAGGPYRVETLVSDPLSGQHGAEATFTDNDGVKRAAQTCLTVRKAGDSDANAVLLPLGETTVVPKESLAGYTFSANTPTQDNSLHLEYGLAFPENMTPVDFKNSLPDVDAPAHSIARLYYTIGFAPRTN